MIGVLIVVTAFYLPLILAIVKIPKSLDKAFLIKYAVILLLCVVLYLIFFKPNVISWAEFPYFENTFERMGFYPRGIHGTKYHFMGSHDLYLYWDLFAKIALLIFLPYFFLNIKKFLDINVLFIVVYLGIMLVTDTFYDRYIMIILPFVLFALARNLRLTFSQKALMSVFILGMGFYSLQMSFDYVVRNNYVWAKALSLEVENDEILANHAWNAKFKSSAKNNKYLFSYDSLEVNPELTCCYYLVEKKSLHYPLSIFLEPNLYLYKKSN